MGAGQLHYEQYINACDSFGEGSITKEEFIAKLSSLGYTTEEIAEELDAAEENERSFT